MLFQFMSTAWDALVLVTIFLSLPSQLSMFVLRIRCSNLIYTVHVYRKSLSGFVIARNGYEMTMIFVYQCVLRTYVSIFVRVQPRMLIFIIQKVMQS